MYEKKTGSFLLLSEIKCLKSETFPSKWQPNLCLQPRQGVTLERPTAGLQLGNGRLFLCMI